MAVEVREPKGMGRCRMAPLADASAASLHQFVTDHVESGATVVTDGWQGYRGLDKLGFSHIRHSQRAARFRGEDPGKLLPAVHQVISLAKRWLLGTHQGAADDAHLASYLNEFVFRFNRRRSRSRGICSFGFSNSPSPTTPCATSTSSPAVGPGKSRQHRHSCVGARRAWRGHRRTARGDRRRDTPVKWIPQRCVMLRSQLCGEVALRTLP